ncbi:MAG: glyoxalase [Cytophagales bacterium CG18_big_fil_WC_8_21_14_2_50_42_9]|nr:MAG: glyoxalase [Cytophagales bacterium CG18_big_fil_WC_8_21_14_2_50_42_9]
MQFVRIKETCLYVQDLQQTKDFYQGKLGLKVIGEVAGRHLFFRAGESVLLCFIAAESAKSQMVPPHFGQGNMHLAFEVSPADYAVRKTEIENLGIPIEMEYDWGRGFLSFYFRDPDQHVLEIVMTGMWEK